MAAAYTIVNAVFLPFRWWYIAKMNIVSFRDLAVLQVPHFLAMALGWLIVTQSKQHLAFTDVTVTLFSIAVLYACSLAAVSTTKSGRSAMREVYAIALRPFRGNQLQ